MLVGSVTIKLNIFLLSELGNLLLAATPGKLSPLGKGLSYLLTMWLAGPKGFL